MNKKEILKAITKRHYEHNCIENEYSKKIKNIYDLHDIGLDLKTKNNNNKTIEEDVNEYNKYALIIFGFCNQEDVNKVNEYIEDKYDIYLSR